MPVKINNKKTGQKVLKSVFKSMNKPNIPKRKGIIKYIFLDLLLTESLVRFS